MLDTTLCNSYLSVNLQTIINNMQSIQEDIGPDVECIPVLKDNAYCLGAVPIAKALCTYANVRTIAVAQVCEGVELRQAGLSAPAVLVLGGVPERLFPAAVEYGLQLTVFHPSTVYALEKLAAAQGKRAEVQIKVETGLNRTGAKPGAELGALATALAACPHVRTMGYSPIFPRARQKKALRPTGSFNFISRLWHSFRPQASIRHRSTCATAAAATGSAPRSATQYASGADCIWIIRPNRSHPGRRVRCRRHAAGAPR